MKCPACEKDCQSEDRFCRHCGASLEEKEEEEYSGRHFRPLYKKTSDAPSAWENYLRPFLGTALIACLGLMALAGLVFGIEYLLRGK
jgi:hypothetical protein